MDEYSVKTAELSGELEQLMGKATDDYHGIIQTNCKWCDVATKYLRSYLQRIRNTTEKEEAMKEHQIVAPMLEEAFKNMTSQQQMLDKIRLNFTEPAEKNRELTRKLFVEYYEYRKSYVDPLLVRLEEDKKNSIGCNLITCWETELTRQLESLIVNINIKEKKAREALDTAVGRANTRTDSTKVKLMNEQFAISDLKIKIKFSSNIINATINRGIHTQRQVRDIQNEMDKLFSECEVYLSKHKY